MSLKVANPIIVTEDYLTSTDIPEPDTAQGEIEWFLNASTDLPSVGTTSNIVMDSREGNLIIGTGNNLYVSNDNGATITAIGTTPTGYQTYGACIDKADSTVMYYCTTDAVYKSTDSGATFTDTGLDPDGVTLLDVAAYGDIVVVCGGDSFVSLDGGATWTTYSYSTRACDITSTYICMITNEKNGVVYQSKTNSISFTEYTIRSGYDGTYVTWSIAGYKENFIIGLVSTIDDGESVLFSSNDGGVSWSDITVEDMSDIASIDVSDSGYFIISWYDIQGVAISTDLGLTWTEYEIDGITTKAIVAISDEYFFALKSFGSKTVYNQKIWKVGDQATVVSEHKIYQCLTAFTDVDPVTGTTGTDGETWAEVGPTNRWAMFDDKTTTPTVNASDFSVVIDQSDYFNTISLFNVEGLESVTIEAKRQNGDIFYNKEVSLLDVSSIYDYYTFFFYQNAYKFEIAIDDIPTYAYPTLTLTFHGSNISIGNLVFGFATDVGLCLADSQSETLDYSTTEYDTYGELTYVERPVVQLNTYEVLSDKDIYQFIQNTLRNIRGVNSLWIGNIGLDQKMITYGRCERSPIPFDMQNNVRWSITVRGSI